jgi:hypothetical protein
MTVFLLKKSEKYQKQMLLSLMKKSQKRYRKNSCASWKTY